jgi:hypothetical protein
MHIINAAKATLKYAEDELSSHGHPENDHLPIELQVPHQKECLNKIINGEVKDEKAHRWFGWAQCALAANGIGDLNIYRTINYACGLQK